MHLSAHLWHFSLVSSVWMKSGFTFHHSFLVKNIYLAQWNLFLGTEKRLWWTCLVIVFIKKVILVLMYDTILNWFWTIKFKFWVGSSLIFFCTFSKIMKKSYAQPLINVLWKCQWKYTYCVFYSISVTQTHSRLDHYFQIINYICTMTTIEIK